MLTFASATAILATLATLTSATPIQKRFTGATIKSYRTGGCLTLTGPAADGTTLTTGDCASATKWDINPGSGSVVVTGTNFALDAGTNPHNFVGAKVWTSYPGLTQQTWYLTPDNRIAITGGDQCLDEGDNGPQTYQCTTGNTNQIWYVSGSNPPPTSSSASASSSSSASASASASSGPLGPFSQLKWSTDQSMCVTVQGTPGNGTPVNLDKCKGAYTSEAAPQRFYTFQNGAIQLAGTNYCLDAGIDPKNGVQMKLWDCYFGLSQQSWSYTAQSGLFQTANNQCLDVDNSNNVRLQTWECSQQDPQQHFTN